jgi:hypothetical protein
MRRSVCLRLTVCLSTAAATAALGLVFAPAASAAPDRTTLLPQPCLDAGNAQNRVPVPPFGRKLV